MPSLIVFPASARMPRVVPVTKKITTIGTDSHNDVVLDDPDVSASHAHILFDGNDFEIAALDRDATLLIHGKARRSARLEDQDIFQCGHTTLQFRIYDVQESAESRGGPEPDDVFRRLFDVSLQLMRQSDIDALLNGVLDQVIQVTSADKGFILLVESGRARVRVARGMDKTDIPVSEASISDSIVRKVLDEGEPLIVSDALHDTHFSLSESVLNLRLCSVMCVPLVARGTTLGLIYVGNDNVVNLFTQQSLEILTVFAAQAALIIHNALVLDELTLDNQRLKETLASVRFGEIIGTCDGMREVFRKVVKVASTDISVLIQGETGTGKELIAKEIHQRSNRVRGPFVVINCGAIPESLLESELFGHLRGAFTGAVATTRGKFQAAHGGTLFLDEVGELPLALQVKLLRAIQEKQVTKIGETRPEKVDIRIVAATNKNLTDEVHAGRFREDLFYRLNVIALHLPPLRERGDDVLLIAKYLLNHYVQEFKAPNVKGFSHEAVRAMRCYSWPGNIRELQNRLKKAVVFAPGSLVTPEDMDLQQDRVPPVLSLADAKDNFQRDYINHVLRLNQGNRTKSARDLDVDPRTIFRHLEKEREIAEKEGRKFEFE